MASQEYNNFLKIIYSNKKAALQALEEKKELLEMRNGVGETPLHYLAIENYIAEVEWQLSHGANIDSQTGFGDTPLINTAQLGYEEMSRLLLKHGATINHQNSNQETALFKAATEGNVVICALLLNSGADPLLNDGMDNILDAAPLEKRAEFIKLFESYGYDEEKILKSLEHL